MHSDEINVRPIGISAIIKQVQAILWIVRRALCQVSLIDRGLVRRDKDFRTHVCRGANAVTSRYKKWPWIFYIRQEDLIAACVVDVGMNVKVVTRLQHSPQPRLRIAVERRAASWAARDAATLPGQDLYQIFYSTGRSFHRTPRPIRVRLDKQRGNRKNLQHLSSF